MKTSEAANPYGRRSQVGRLRGAMGHRQARVVLALAALLLLASVVLAQGGFELSWWSVDGGGATASSGGDYSLAGSIAQPEAGALTGGGYSLEGGVPVDGAEWRQLHLPVVVRGS